MTLLRFKINPDTEIKHVVRIYVQGFQFLNDRVFSHPTYSIINPTAESDKHYNFVFIVVIL